MKLTKILLLIFVSSILSCSDIENYDEASNNTPPEFEYSLRGEKVTILFDHISNVSHVYKENQLAITYEVTGKSYQKLPNNKNLNQYQFYNSHKDKTFLLDNLTLVDDYSFTFDLYVDGILLEADLLFESSEKINNMQKSTIPPLWPIFLEAIDNIVESVTDAFETSEQNETCQQAITACQAAGGLPQVQSNDDGCTVICKEKENE